MFQVATRLSTLVSPMRCDHYHRRPSKVGQRRALKFVLDDANGVYNGLVTLLYNLSADWSPASLIVVKAIKLWFLARCDGGDFPSGRISFVLITRESVSVNTAICVAQSYDLLARYPEYLA